MIHIHTQHRMAKNWWVVGFEESDRSACIGEYYCYARPNIPKLWMFPQNIYRCSNQIPWSLCNSSHTVISRSRLPSKFVGPVHLVSIITVNIITKTIAKFNSANKYYVTIYYYKSCASSPWEIVDFWKVICWSIIQIYTHLTWLQKPCQEVFCVIRTSIWTTETQLKIAKL